MADPSSSLSALRQRIAARRAADAVPRDSSSSNEQPSFTTSNMAPWQSELAAVQAIVPGAENRTEQLNALQKSPHATVPWANFLEVVQRDRAAVSRTNTGHTEQNDVSAMRNAVLRLYLRATRILPITAANRHDSIYLKLWLDLASIQAEDPDSIHDAKSTFKLLKIQRIGLDNPILYNAWAELEEKSGNFGKALKLRNDAKACRPLLPVNSKHAGNGNSLALQSNTDPGTFKNKDVLSIGTNNLGCYSQGKSGATGAPSPSCLPPKTPHSACPPAIATKTSSAPTPFSGRPPRRILGPLDANRDDVAPSNSPEHNMRAAYSMEPTKAYSPENVPVGATHSFESTGKQMLLQDARVQVAGQAESKISEDVVSSHDENKERRSTPEKYLHHTHDSPRRGSHNNFGARQASPQTVHQSPPKSKHITFSGGEKQLTPAEEAQGGRHEMQSESDYPKSQVYSNRKFSPREHFVSTRPTKSNVFQDLMPSPRHQRDEIGNLNGTDSLLTEKASPQEPSGSGRSAKAPFPYPPPENTIIVNTKPYLVLELVGKGGSSKVYKVLSSDMKIYALKRVKVPESSRDALESYANEIKLLQDLRGQPTIIQLYDAEVLHSIGVIHLIMEYGDIDLAKLLARRKGKTLNENCRRLYWQQMLEAVNTIHVGGKQKIIHGDLKPANFLHVTGTLKLIDFGIAKAVQTDDTTKIVRDSQIGTPNYMSPEALMAEDDHQDDDSSELSSPRNTRKSRRYTVGRASDIWSLGCILYQMVYGRTPFAHIKNTMHKLNCIQDPTYEIVYPESSCIVPNLLDVLQGCLQRDPSKRLSMESLLSHPYVCQANGSDARDAVLSRTVPRRASIPSVRENVRAVLEVLEEIGYALHIPSSRADEFERDVTERVIRHINRVGVSNGLDEKEAAVSNNYYSRMTPTSSAITGYAQLSTRSR